MTFAPERLLAFLFAATGEQLRAVAPADPAAWRDLVATCESLDASGLAHAALRRTRTADLPPEDVRAALRLAHATAAAQNLALEAEARRVLDALRTAGLAAAPMKGAALFVEGIVGDLGSRPTGDFDLVTERADRAAVLETIRGLGYEPRFREASWKHLPALWRGDLSIEVHEIAYWSAATRAIHGAHALASPDRATRIGHLCALQVHHLVLGSPPEASLTVRTLADLDAFLALGRREPDVRAAMLRAAREAGVDRELAACDAILARARGAETTLGLGATAAEAHAILAPLRDTGPRDPRMEILAHAFRIVPIQPWQVTWEMISLLAFPPAAVVGARMSQDARAGSVSLARLRRPIELAYRVARALPATLRTRPGPKRRPP